ncbi:helix-turn-helix domain-containing protein [Bacillus shivajii]|uniref:helix-turn-helix domain-containing protein n=1 Tax=Bacillus shivajii TaxID=1983719 RepID=UPI001CFBED6F|nr:helix-turn-helix domain-containing protein [Bacillus shivajii]UCZ54735.1 helix-turn-helix domain-containing protein [Bacillus shivajii]
MSMMQWLCLKVIDRIGSERSLTGVYYLLSGKKSFQTIQDAHLFRCSPYVGTLKLIEKASFDEMIIKGEKHGWFHFDKPNHARLTDNGKKKLNEYGQTYKLPDDYNGAKYEWNDYAVQYWDRLSLMVQTCAFFIKGNNRFIPVSYNKDTQLHVKSILLNEVRSPKDYSEQLLKELRSILKNVSDLEAWLFVQRLTSTDKTGQTFTQLSNHFKGDSLHTKLTFFGVIHKIIQMVQSNEQRSPALKLLLPKTQRLNSITETASITNHLLMSHSIDEVAKIRHLKRSTIEDHIIELAIYDVDFPVNTYIKIEQVEQINDAAEKLKTKKLRVLKEYFGNQYSYFQLRLALTVAEKE